MPSLALDLVALRPGTTPLLEKFVQPGKPLVFELAARGEVCPRDVWKPVVGEVKRTIEQKQAHDFRRLKIEGPFNEIET